MKRLAPFLAITSLIALGTTATAQILAWDTNGLAGDELIFSSTTTNPNLNTSVLTRGPGLSTKSPMYK